MRTNRNRLSGTLLGIAILGLGACQDTSTTPALKGATLQVNEIQVVTAVSEPVVEAGDLVWVEFHLIETDRGAASALRGSILWDPDRFFFPEQEHPSGYELLSASMQAGVMTFRTASREVLEDGYLAIPLEALKDGSTASIDAEGFIVLRAGRSGDEDGVDAR